MAKKKYDKHYDQKLVDALKKITSPIYDKKHQFYVYFINDQARTNKTRFEHIAKRGHELKVRDIESITNGINNYIAYTKSKDVKDTYRYYIKRKGKDRGFIVVAILVDINDKSKAYIKTIFINYSLK